MRTAVPVDTKRRHRQRVLHRDLPDRRFRRTRYGGVFLFRAFGCFVFVFVSFVRFVCLFVGWFFCLFVLFVRLFVC